MLPATRWSAARSHGERRCSGLRGRGRDPRRAKTRRRSVFPGRLRRPHGDPAWPRWALVRALGPYDPSVVPTSVPPAQVAMQGPGHDRPHIISHLLGLPILGQRRRDREDKERAEARRDRLRPARRQGDGAAGLDGLWQRRPLKLELACWRDRRARPVQRKTTLSTVQRHVEHAPRGNGGSRREPGRRLPSSVNIDREAGPVSRSVTRDRSFFCARPRDSFEMRWLWADGQTQGEVMDRGRDRASTCSVDGATRSKAAKFGSAGVSVSSVRRRLGVVRDGPRLIVSSVRRKARARPSFADSRHPRRAPWKLNKG